MGMTTEEEEETKMLSPKRFASGSPSSRWSSCRGALTLSGPPGPLGATLCAGGGDFFKKLEFFQIFYSSKKNFTQIFFNFFEEFWVLFRVLEKH